MLITDAMTILVRSIELKLMGISEVQIKMQLKGLSP